MRYKEFNRNKVLEQCIRLFWKNGFNACAISNIVEETGVNRFSLYQEFDNKDGILHHSLLLYRERYSYKNLDILEKEGDPSEVLKSFYLSYLQGEGIHDGCYFIHIGTEMADNDQKVKGLLDNALSEIEDLMVELLMRKYKPMEAKFYARHLVGLFCTTMSFCLIHSDQERIRHITNGIDIIMN